MNHIITHSNRMCWSGMELLGIHYKKSFVQIECITPPSSTTAKFTTWAKVGLHTIRVCCIAALTGKKNVGFPDKCTIHKHGIKFSYYLFKYRQMDEREWFRMRHLRG